MKPYEVPVESCLGLLSGRHLGLRLVLSQESIPPGITFEIGRVGYIVGVEHSCTPRGGAKVKVTDQSGAFLIGDPGTACRLERPEEDEPAEPACDCGFTGAEGEKHKHTCSWGRWHLVNEFMAGRS
jgi:hypothetical protein